ncbi:MAG: type IV secretion system protein [Alphaproteobacteria bacterium]|nr:type IV secretion system protein [Rickettsiales bacterium]
MALLKIGKLAKKKPSVNKPKTNVRKRKITNWYVDRYLAIAVQRNVLFLFSALASIGVLIGLILIKVMYDQRAIDPYLIEVEPDTGIATIVDYKTKKEYTAQEALKESLLVSYVSAKEAYDVNAVERNMDYVRVFSTKASYEEHVKNYDESIKLVRRYGQRPSAQIKIRSLNYITPTRVALRFAKIVSAENKPQTKEYKYMAIVSFQFSDLELNLEDRRLNPFGFQVVSYMLQIEYVED